VVGGKANAGKLQVAGMGPGLGWKATCSQGFTELEARVACRDLGWHYGGIVRSANDYGAYPPGPSGRNDSIALAQYNISCPGGAQLDLVSCNVKFFNASQGETCTSGPQAVECYDGAYWQRWLCWQW